MKPYPTASDVIESLGQPFLNAFVDAVAGAEEDRQADLRAHPSWHATYSQRHVASFLHERIWGRLLPTLRELPGVQVVDNEPERSVICGSYQVRFKRHRRSGSISTFPTDGAVRFYNNRAEPLSDEMTTWSVAMGYLWDDDQVQYPLISLREDLDTVVWVRPLERSASRTEPDTTVRALTVERADLPEFDLTTLVDEDISEAE